MRVQAAGRVDEDDVAVARLGRLDGVERHRSRIPSAGGADEVGPGAVGPDLQLLVGRGAERVRGGDDHVVVVLA